MMIQPMVSSTMAEPRITWPTVRRRKFISRTTVATIFTEAIDSAVPRNSDVISRLLGSGSMASGRNSPSAKPQANGMMMPKTDAEIEARLLSLTSLRSVSMPVISRISSTPNCDIAVEHRLLLFGGRKQGVLQVREQRAEERRAEHQAGHELSHHGGLPQPQQGFAQQPADQHQHHELNDEDRLGGAVAAGLHRRPRRPPRWPAEAATDGKNQPRDQRCLGA